MSATTARPTSPTPSRAPAAARASVCNRPTPTPPRTSPSSERTLQSIGTLFAQYVTGYLGTSVERRGKNAEHQAAFSRLEIQDLLDEWIVTGWQNRPHDGLRDPFTPSRMLTPNEKYAALLAVRGYVPVPFGAEDYLELMPAEARVINSYGVKIRHRVYDTADLNPYRGQNSGMKALKDLWEVRYDPYDAGCVWIRNHHDGGWITAYWRQLLPGGEKVTPLGSAVKGTYTGQVTIDLGTAPEGTTGVRVELICLSPGSFTYPDGASSQCTQKEVGGETSDAIYTVKYAAGMERFTVVTEPDTRWKLTAKYVHEEIIEWARNAKGETYGVINERGEPDLIAVAATTGQSGYVYKNDLKEASGNLEGKAFSSPEEAMAWIDSHRGKPIPVYDKEGETKFGEFISGR